MEFTNTNHIYYGALGVELIQGINSMKGIKSMKGINSIVLQLIMPELIMLQLIMLLQLITNFCTFSERMNFF